MRQHVDERAMPAPVPEQARALERLELLTRLEVASHLARSAHDETTRQRAEQACARIGARLRRLGEPT